MPPAGAAALLPVGLLPLLPCKQRVSHHRTRKGPAFAATRKRCALNATSNATAFAAVGQESNQALQPSNRTSTWRLHNAPSARQQPDGALRSGCSIVHVCERSQGKARSGTQARQNKAFEHSEEGVHGIPPPCSPFFPPSLKNMYSRSRGACSIALLHPLDQSPLHSYTQIPLPF